MPRYKCLRKCFDDNRIFQEGRKYTLGKKYDGNHHFKRLGGLATPDVEEAEDETPLVDETEEDKDEDEDKDGEGEGSDDGSLLG